MTRISGLVLAAGRGARFGGPKVLAVDDAGRSWLALAVAALQDGGVRHVVAVVPHGLTDSLPRDVVRTRVEIVEAPPHAVGVSQSLRTGLDALHTDVAVVTLVDLPGLPATVVARVLEDSAAPSTLRRAVYEGQPGHPVVIGSEHWQPLRERLDGDRGAGRYLRERAAEQIECSDLFHGNDIDMR